MTTLTLNECKTFSIKPIDYDNEEAKVREHNIDILRDLLHIISNNSCLEILNSENIDCKHIYLPEEMKNFYKKHVEEVSFNTTNKKILTKIKNEYNDLMIKIKNFADRWSINEEFVKNDLLKGNDMFLLTFAKDPGKQTFHQHLAAKWLSQLPFVQNFQELPAGGKDALYIHKGIIIRGETKKNKTDEVIPKSIDFSWKYQYKDKVLQFYATHKHTKTSGGSQDNQYRDVQEFHIQAKECKDSNYCLVSITDGPYYHLNESIVKDMTKIQYLNSPLFKGERNLATNINQFANDIIPYIISWLHNNFDINEIQGEIEKLNTLKTICSF